MRLKHPDSRMTPARKLDHEALKAQDGMLARADSVAPRCCASPRFSAARSVERHDAAQTATARVTKRHYEFNTPQSGTGAAIHVHHTPAGTSGTRVRLLGTEQKAVRLLRCALCTLGTVPEPRRKRDPVKAQIITDCPVQPAYRRLSTSCSAP